MLRTFPYSPAVQSKGAPIALGAMLFAHSTFTLHPNEPERTAANTLAGGCSLNLQRAHLCFLNLCMTAGNSAVAGIPLQLGLTNLTAEAQRYYSHKLAGAVKLLNIKSVVETRLVPSRPQVIKAALSP